jgi:hypothetical protein
VRRWDPTRDDWKVGADDDYRQAAYRINDITDDAESIDLLYSYARRRCVLLVEHYWPEICTLATVLLAEKKLSGEQARRIWADSLKARRGRLMSW